MKSRIYTKSCGKFTWKVERWDEHVTQGSCPVLYRMDLTQIVVAELVVNSLVVEQIPANSLTGTSIIPVEVSTRFRVTRQHNYLPNEQNQPSPLKQRRQKTMCGGLKKAYGCYPIQFPMYKPIAITTDYLKPGVSQKRQLTQLEFPHLPDFRGLYFLGPVEQLNRTFDMP